ncbi:hypothetical protein [Arthrobacter sp. UYEF3]|uniref:hypothetical protein n=1 Tax=Arthrobacter sp. UYEF3 TaxID=1756365 RepID=UPI0033960223
MAISLSLGLLAVLRLYSGNFVPVADAALNGLTAGLLGGGAACFALAVLLLGRVPARGAGPSVRADPDCHCHARR